MTKNSSDTFKDIEKTFEEYLVKKAPLLPKDIQELIVNYGPWLIVLFAIMTLPGILAALGFGAFFSGIGFMMGPLIGTSFGFIWLFSLAVALLLFAAIPGLFKKKLRSWRLLLYATLVGVVMNIISFQISGLIGSVLSLYILFQVKHHYK